MRVAPPRDPAPSVLSVAPSSLLRGDTATLAIEGAGFGEPMEGRLGPGIAVEAIRWLAATSVEIDVRVDAAASLGARDLVIVNGDLQAAALPGAITILDRTRSSVLSCDPAAGIQGTRVAVVVLGDAFDPAAVLDVGAGIRVEDAVVDDPGTLRATLLVDPGAPMGSHDVSVTNPDGLGGSLPAGFEVLPPAPPLPSVVVPADVSPGSTTALDVQGSGFADGLTFDFGAGLTAGPAMVLSPFRARVMVHCSGRAVPGARDLVAANIDGSSGTLTDALLVVARPALRAVILAFDDWIGNANGALDPADVAGLDVSIWNASDVPATDLVLRISDPSPGLGLTIRRATTSLPDVAPWSSSRRPGPPLPEIALSASVPCGSALPLDLEIRSGGSPVSTTRVMLPVGRVRSWARKPAIDGVSPAGRRGAAVLISDLDGDGIGDLIAGAPQESPAATFAAGRVVAVSGATDDPLWTLDGEEILGNLGGALAGTGDIDGDGGEDLLVGAPGESSASGRIRLVSGRTGAILAEVVGEPGERLGSALAMLGDRNLDGDVEALAGAPEADSGAGRVIVLELPGLQELERLAGRAGEGLGSAVASPGDVDDDGHADAIATASRSGPGRVVLWPAAGSVLERAGRMDGDRFGGSVAAGADVDGDGVGDILVGAPGDSSAGTSAGRVELLSGRLWTPLRQWLGDAAGDEFGAAVAFAADVDVDGVVDLHLGAPGAAADAGSVELRSGATGELLGAFDGASGAGRFGESLAGGRDAGGDAFDDLLVGQPRATTSSPLAGRAVALKTAAACDPVVACLPDALEPNDPPAATVLGHGDVAGLTICRGDVDDFALAPPPSGRMLVRAVFRHADGDLDAVLLDAAGMLVESSSSIDDDEALGPFGSGGTWTVRVVGYDDAVNTYSLLVIDPDACPPTEEIRALRVSKASGRAILSWQPSTDRCHASPPADGYRIWSAPSPRPSGPVRFPAGTLFSDASALDRDGDATDERFVDDRSGTMFYLVTDLGRAGEDGPVGAY